MRATLLMLILTYSAFGQTPAQQKALNNYADFANQSADEVAAVVMSIIQYYPSIHQKSSFGAPRYTCPIQLEEYYLKTAQAESKLLPSSVANGLNMHLLALQGAAETVDGKCKELDTYHKLEDYKKDNFARASAIINELQGAVRAYRLKQDGLAAEMELAFKKLNPTAAQTSYGKADVALKNQIARERSFLDNWTFNLNEATPTGWPVDKVQLSITETSDALTSLKKQQPALKYPASSMWSNFQESLSSVLEAKRNALDEYNHEAKKSDRHANDVYLGLINYFNGTLVSDQNTFIQYAASEGYHGLKSIKFFPLFEIRSQAVSPSMTVKPFDDYPHSPLHPPGQKAALSKSAYGALVNYIDFINEAGRQSGHLALILSNFSGSAAYYKSLDSYAKHGGMSFDYKDYQVPLSQYQKTISESSLLPPTFATSLNKQAEVLLNMLKELDAIAATLEREVDERKYEQDRLAHVYGLLERTKVVLQAWDDKKELLYDDVRSVFDAYPVAQPTSSWFISGKALRRLTDLDHDALFKAKAFYQGGQSGSTTAISTQDLDAALREVISKEYQNMKGIEKIGRNNGLCPYTPYEDLPTASKKLSEDLNPLRTGKGRGYQHPYYTVLYSYNEAVRQYNKFCELSTSVFLLPTVFQPQLFELEYPKDNNAPATSPASRPPVTNPASATAANGSAGTGPVENNTVSVSAASSGTLTRTTSDNGNVAATGTIGDAAAQSAASSSGKVAQETNAQHPNVQPPAHGQDVTAVPSAQPSVQQKMQRDTVYIERRDTVYLTANDENLRSMEGYAINHVVLLLDISGSMNAPEKLPLLKSSVLQLVSMMRVEDKVSIIAFSDKPKVLLSATSFKDASQIERAINALKSSGKTDGNAGVKLAYKVADENYVRGGNNRIILATDGEFGLNEATRETIRKFSTEDIFLSIFNFGKGAGASRALEQVAQMGKGNYQYISKENVELQLIREVKAKRAR